MNRLTMTGICADTPNMDRFEPIPGVSDQERLDDDTLHALLRYALDSAFDSVLIHRPNGTLIYCNESAAADAGMTVDQLMNAGPWAWTACPPDLRDERVRELEVNGEGCFISEGLDLGDGKKVLEVNARWLETPFGPLIMSVTRDISEKLAVEASLREMAFHDPLTGLANRALLDDRLKLAIAGAQRHADLVGVLFIDIDDFKPVNDTYGHETGDRVLKVLATRMTNAVRSEDTVARLGGDEFIVLLTRLKSPADLEGAARKIARVIESPIEIDGCPDACCIRASIGYAAFDPESDDAHSVVIRADLAMYKGRRAGHQISGGEAL